MWPMMMDDTDFEAQTNWAGAGGHIPGEASAVQTSHHWDKRRREPSAATGEAAEESLWRFHGFLESRMRDWPT